MELKFCFRFWSFCFCRCLNWTFMELKYSYIITLCSTISSLNWTFMELKSDANTPTPTPKTVWIEPLWNWNWRHERHRGWPIYVWIEPLWNWNKGAVVGERAKRAVWIEPLWNWNYYIFIISIYPPPFELNLYGIEMGYSWAVRSVCPCLNWTFMELKFFLFFRCTFAAFVWIEPLWNWNESVWIEPLWNWNCHSQLQCFHSCCLNWTFMELKSYHSILKEAQRVSLNWTFMELKFLP